MKEYFKPKTTSFNLRINNPLVISNDQLAMASDRRVSKVLKSGIHYRRTLKWPKHKKLKELIKILFL